jgi:hypothetical protein
MRITSVGIGGKTTSTEKLLEGVALRVWGHSYTSIPAFVGANGISSATPTSGEWPFRVAQRLGMNFTSNGRSGSIMVDVAQAAVGTTTTAYGVSKTLNPSSKGVIAVEGTVNDLNNALSGNTLFQNMYKHALRTFLALAQAGFRTEAATATQSGTWSSTADTVTSAGTYLKSNTAAASLTFNNVSAPAGYVWLLTFGYDASILTGTIGVEVDSVDAGISYTGTGQITTYTGLIGSNQTRCPVVIKIPVPASGTHTVKIKKTDADVSANGFINIDALIIPATNPASVFVLKEPPSNSPKAGGAGVGTIGDSYNTYAPVYHGLIDSVIAEFNGPVYTIVTADGWDSNTMISVNDITFALHPNDLGHHHIADKVVAAIKANVSNFVAGVTYI